MSTVVLALTLPATFPYRQSLGFGVHSSISSSGPRSSPTWGLHSLPYCSESDSKRISLKRGLSPTTTLRCLAHQRLPALLSSCLYFSSWNPVSEKKPKSHTVVLCQCYNRLLDSWTASLTFCLCALTVIFFTLYITRELPTCCSWSFKNY